MKMYEALKYFERGLCPIPLFSQVMLDRGEMPDGYLDKKNEILLDTKAEDEPVDEIEKEELIRALNIDACKQSLPEIDIDALQTRRPSESEVRQWFINHPEANMGLMIGPKYNLVVVDVDKNIASAFHQSGKVPIGPPIVETYNSFHYYFSYSSAKDLYEATDQTGVILHENTSYAVAPPSVHGSGFVYRWRRHYATSMSLFDSDFWLLKFIMDIINFTDEEKERMTTIKCFSCID